ncbi:cell division protein CrgA [Brachybacterium saurashtrense]|uniref:Cell division protein CrgA n=1 Tax=Brachybacterium saurashtrense TaxID=556288 RepID=A0A345YTK7_9MICO|nr:cell division protein CrgA [Brachybacterium saurashtrense]RRR24380.1 cell division protein CrgA [Brachybacterium saurashtrense]
MRRKGGAGKSAAGKSGAGKTAAKTAGGEVTEKAKDSTRSTSVKKAAAEEGRRTTGRRVAAAPQNPAWLAPTAVVCLVLGLLYLVTYYISAGQLPLPIGDWNLAAGFGVLLVGGGMLMFWK